MSITTRIDATLRDLTAVMVCETTRRHGQVAAAALGVILLGLSAATLVVGATAA